MGQASSNPARCKPVGEIRRGKVSIKGGCAAGKGVPRNKERT